MANYEFIHIFAIMGIVFEQNIFMSTLLFCEKTIRTAKGSVLLSFFSIDNVISLFIYNYNDADVKSNGRPKIRVNNLVTQEKT